MSTQDMHALAVRQPVAFEMVPIAGDHIAAMMVDGVVWVSVRRMCEVLGLDVSGQRQRLSDRERTSWAVTGMTPSTGPDGKIYEVFCLDLDSVPMWLATIDASRVRPESKAKIVAFQREAARVLRDHFFRRSAIVVPDDLEGALLLAADRERERKRLAALLLAQQPMADLGKAVCEAQGTLSYEEVAKSVNIGRNSFIDLLRKLGIVQAKPSTLPYQQHIDAGRFEVIQAPKNGRVFPVARLTPKGQEYCLRKLGILPDPSNDLQLRAGGDE